MLRSLMMLAVFAAMSFAASLPGVFFRADEWYEGLRRPALTPPGWVFGVVWTCLYSLMATAAWQLWRHGGLAENRIQLAVFVLQLIFNAAWTCIFFGLHRPGLALIELGCLWIAVLATTVVFWRRDAVAGILLTPYLAWVSFAAYLNFEFWRLNR